jgi:hypothetical protein
LTAARATFALKAAVWFLRGRLLIRSPLHSHLKAAGKQNFHLNPYPNLRYRLSVRPLVACHYAVGPSLECTAGSLREPHKSGFTPWALQRIYLIRLGFSLEMHTEESEQGKLGYIGS